MIPVASHEVIKHSAAVAITSRVTLLQRRAWNVLLAHAFDNLITTDRHYVGLTDLVDALALSTNNTTHLRELLKGLVSTVVEWNVLRKDGKQRWGAAALLAAVEVEGGVVEYSFAPQLRERLYRPDIYARISLSIQNKFRSKYALALYELSVDYLGVNQTPWIPLADFRRLMGLKDDEYPEYKEFNRRVVARAVREINKVSDVSVQVKTRKEGRSVAALKILVRAKAATAAAAVEAVQVGQGGRRQLPPVLDEPDAFEQWLAGLSPLEQSAFEERAQGAARQQHPRAGDMALRAFTLMMMREMWASEQGSNPAERTHAEALT